jgi:cell division protein FtsL
MSRQRIKDILPFLSVLILVATLFSLVLAKMEVRRMGYFVLRQSQEQRKLQDRHRMLAMEYAQLTRPDRVRKYAVSRLNLNDSHSGQIIQLAGQRLAMPQ